MIEMTGRKYGRLLVLRRAPVVAKGVKWECLCDCGVIKVVDGNDLRKPDGRATRSCGCMQREKLLAYSKSCTGKPGHHTTHGLSGSLEYSSWANMWQRCTNPNDPKFHCYGARGITICERWQDFEAFFADMGLRPSADHSIDRIHNDGNYEPGNCRWATRSQQNKNRRHFNRHRKTMIYMSEKGAAPFGVPVALG